MSKKEKIKKNIIVEVVGILMLVMIIIGCSDISSEREVKSIVAAEMTQSETERAETDIVEELQASVEYFNKEAMKRNIVLVNKQNKLASDYVPENLITVNVKSDGEVKLEKETSEMIKLLFSQAANEGVSLFLVSGYRPYKYQNKIYENSLKNCGHEYTEKYVAKPGESEHQTGLAADIASVNNRELTEQFANTREGQWLSNNAYRFGFILRYLKGKESITGYGYEPWHIRYVGREAAEELHNSGITLEEYLKMN